MDYAAHRHNLKHTDSREATGGIETPANAHARHVPIQVHDRPQWRG